MVEHANSFVHLRLYYVTFFNSAFIWLAIAITYLVPMAATSQDTSISFEDARFSGREKSRKKALRHIKMADGIIDLDHDYKSAAKFYQRAEKFNAQNSLLNYKLGVCYYKMAEPDYTVAALYFEKALKLMPVAESKTSYFLGRSYHRLERWQEAIEQYSAYRKSLSPDQTEEIAKAEKLMAECQYGIQLSATPKRVIFQNLGRSINSQYPETGPVVSPDESLMFFTASRKSTTGYEATDDGWFMTDLYMAQFKANRWSRTTKVSSANSAGHEAVINFAANGQRLLVYKGAENGSLYSYTLSKNKVGTGNKLPSVFNSNAKETSAVLTSDLKTIYFTSNREGGQGGLDIWKSVRNAEGKWGKAENLGSSINSSFDEDGLFLSPDDKTLYFSSKGHSSMGGYDIFRSTLLQDNSWGKPENLGYPINTPDNDLYLSVTGNGKYIYYANARQADAKGNLDLYKVTILGEEKKPQLAPVSLLASKEASKIGLWELSDEMMLYSNDLTILKGIVYDSLNRKPMLALLTLSDNELNKTISKFVSNPTTGEFTITIPSGKNYGLAVTATGYLLHSENFSLTAINGGERYKEIWMQPIKAGSQVQLNNIFFDLGKASLSPSSKSELAHLVVLLKENPTVQVEIIGHTDNTGTKTFNQELSIQRARAVVTYLVSQGVDRRKLTYQGFGDSKPIASNDTEEGKKRNRRTELKIVE